MDQVTALLADLDLASALFALVGLPILVFEVIRLLCRHSLDGHRAKGMVTSIFCAVPATLVEILLGGALVAIAFGVSAVSPWSIPTSWTTALVCLVLTDLTYYWEHRFGHRINLLWSLYHSVHHSGDHYDQSIAFRVSFMDFFFTPIFYLPLIVVGFDPLLVLTCVALAINYQTWIHTETIGRLQWLDPWLNTPSNHRVHHGRNPQYLDKNYGGVLMVWDRLFGTYEPEGEKVSYGLVQELKSRNPMEVHFHSLKKLWRMWAATPGAANRLKLIVSPPHDQL